MHHTASDVVVDLGCETGTSGHMHSTHTAGNTTYRVHEYTIHYKLTRFRLARPDEGSCEEKVACPVCGKKVTLVISSPRRVLIKCLTMLAVGSFFAAAFFVAAIIVYDQAIELYWLAWPLAIIGLCILPVAVIGVLGLGDRFWSNVIDKKSAKGKHKLFKPVEASQPWPAWLKDACAGVGAFVLVVGMVVLVGAFGGFIYIACRSVFLKEVGSIGPIAVDDNVTRWHSTSEWGRFLQGAWWTIRVLLPIFALMTVFAPARGEENPYHSIFDSLRGKNTSCDRSREMAICRSAGIGMAILAFILWVSLPSAVTGTWELTPDGFGTPDQTYVWKDIRAIAFRGNNIEVTTAAGTDKQTRPQSMALVKLEKKEESNVQAWSQHLSRFAPKVQLAVEFSEMSRDRKVITRTEILFPSSGNPKAKAGG